MDIAVAHSSSPYVSTYPWTGAFGTKISNPGTLPTGDGRDVSFTALGDYMAVAHLTSPYISTYPWSGAFGTKISNPGTLPTGSGLGVAFSPADDAIVVGHATTPYVSAYPWNGAFGSKIADPSTLPTGDCNYVAFTPSGDAVALAHGTTPFVSVYPWTGAFGTKVANPGTLPPNVGNGVSFSPTGDAIVVAHVTTPFISAYPWNGTFGTKISNPGTLPASNGLNTSFTPSGDTIAVAHVNSPYISAYPWNGSFGTKISDPGTLPTGNGLGIAFAPTGDAVAIAHATTPFITAYPWSGAFGTKIADPGTLPTSTGQDVAFRQTAGDLNVLHGATPVVSGQTTPIDFGRITAGDAEAQQTFTVQNLGEQTITISSVSVPAGFEIDAGSQIPAVGTTVLGGANKSLIVNLLAAVPGRKRGNITINSNDHDEPAYTFAVTGFVQVATTAEDLFADPSSLIGYHGYDSRGNQVLAIDPKGNTTVTVFDGASRPVQVSQHLRRRGQGSQPPAAGETLLPFGGGSITTSTRYDANGRVTELVDDRGSVTRYEYDSLDRRTKMIFHDGATRQYSYNEAGDVVGYIDENGSEYENTFDALGRRTQCAITKASGVIGTDQQTAQYDGLSRATFSRDSISSAHADVAVVYDSLGRVVEDKQTFDGNTRTAVNEKFTSYPVSQQKFPSGRQISNVHDPLYRRTQVGETGGAAIADWAFFGPTRLAEVKLAANSGGANLYCSFMNNDRTRSAIQPGQTTPAWGNQSSDRLGYDAAGRLITKRYLLTDLAGTAYDSTSAVMGQTTAYDRASNKLYERALHAESRSHLYSSPFQGEDTGEGVSGYDSIDRLRQYQRGTLATDGAAIDTPISLPNTNESRTYDLDGLGNWRRTTFTLVGGSETKEIRQHNALNQITSIKEGSNPKVAFTYDANGNLTNDGSRSYEWDAINRLKKVYKTPSSPVLIAEYTYDALGRRIRKTVSNGGLNGSIPNGTTDYIYHSGIAQCCEERQEIATVDTPTKQYVWGIYIDELIQQKNLLALNNFSAAVELYPLQDTLYRTTALADSAGAIREAYDCDAYGNTIIFRKSGSPPSVIGWADGDTQVVLPTCDFIFTGRRYDAETQLYFYRARYYDSRIGRFVSRDPVAYEKSASLYQYAACSSITYVDPSGSIEFEGQIPSRSGLPHYSASRNKFGFLPVRNDNGRIIAEWSPYYVNCFGYATGFGYYLEIQRTFRATLANLAKEMGFDCVPLLPGKTCECDAEADHRMIVYMYKIIPETNPDGTARNPWNEELAPRDDAHAIKADSGKGPSIWRQIVGIWPRFEALEYPAEMRRALDPFGMQQLRDYQSIGFGASNAIVQLRQPTVINEAQVYKHSADKPRYCCCKKACDSKYVVPPISHNVGSTMFGRSR